MSDMGLKCREIPAASQSDGEETQELIAPNKYATALRNNRIRVRISLAIVVAFTTVALVVHSLQRELTDANLLRVVTWNIAAINNNPFEYWITHADAEYGALMEHVQEFVDAPGERDVAVSEVFTPARWLELKALMSSEGWAGLEETQARWQSDLMHRKIISGFLKDSSIGEKRLASMPDRVSNTIKTSDQGEIYRPTVINCFSGDLTTMRKWWKEWKFFMFNKTLKLQSASSSTRPISMLQKIKRSKYPALTAEEEAISLPLQTLAQAIFDAVLVHIVNQVSPTGKWQVLRQQMCEALNQHKDERTLEILARTYDDADLVFLQETAMAFVKSAEDDETLGQRYLVLKSESLDGKRDQNSLILLRKSLFVADTIVEHTDAVMSSFSKSVPVANGDLLVMGVDDTLGRKYLLASFHGDTNGLATLPVFSAVTHLAATMPERRLIFGLDANTYEHGSASKQDVLEFARAFVAEGYTSCWGDSPDPTNHTTFNARTFLQAQLQKAARSNEKISKGDKNPKDFILFPKSAYNILRTTKDNTGKQKYIEGMVFPTLEFPSDHGVLSTVLQVRSP
mmetsp:Transcript_75501/g.125891  ORF Transcript_75501/g.125891 Transcript_75501/m.125891 type:complete len:569 (-) Transcript_75501:750-2456(-)|eukprot:CAMPEP_0119311216 /NCGR_PEP_ID=MMETSP1333-20130426/21975_1 /TAXON_ID=418940 /ORGANISM="Scyphosphaera apsteinii, Strain RCC1455" /LENGTH=568 /DNA_ID=CAMNT_0007315545 /DNA_START=80 /DNA_END=1786 /DNA_ORIENTATION=-